jgi:hypothetical protein
MDLEQQQVTVSITIIQAVIVICTSNIMDRYTRDNKCMSSSGRRTCGGLRIEDA